MNAFEIFGTIILSYIVIYYFNQWRIGQAKRKEEKVAKMKIICLCGNDLIKSNSYSHSERVYNVYGVAQMHYVYDCIRCGQTSSFDISDRGTPINYRAMRGSNPCCESDLGDRKTGREEREITRGSNAKG